MRVLLSILLPCMTFFNLGRPWAGVVCLALQITLFGWLPAALWGLYALSHHNNSLRIRRAVMRTF